MPEKGILYIRMLGEFALVYDEKKLANDNNRSAKLWLLLEYLLTFRHRAISQKELIELLWPNGESENPFNALKTLLHRLRINLKELGFQEGRKMILQNHGTYIWNNQMNFAVDIDLFEQYYRQTMTLELSLVERCQAGLQGISLYQGDFLAKRQLETWSIPIRMYYHNLYLKLVHQLIELLKEEQSYGVICDICYKAITIAPYDEDLYNALILALLHCHRQQEALAQYENMCRVFEEQFGTRPTTKLTTLYQQMIKRQQYQEEDDSNIKEKLPEWPRKKGAFLCEFEFFKDICRLQARTLSHIGQSAYLCLLTVGNLHHEKQNMDYFNMVMQELSESICLTLRAGDIYSRYSISQYIILLCGLTDIDVGHVLERILHQFKKVHLKDDVTINREIQLLGWGNTNFSVT